MELIEHPIAPTGTWLRLYQDAICLSSLLIGRVHPRSAEEHILKTTALYLISFEGAPCIGSCASQTTCYQQKSQSVISGLGKQAASFHLPLAESFNS